MQLYSVQVSGSINHLRENLGECEISSKFLWADGQTALSRVLYDKFPTYSYIDNGYGDFCWTPGLGLVLSVRVFGYILMMYTSILQTIVLDSSGEPESDWECLRLCRQQQFMGTIPNVSHPSVKVHQAPETQFIFIANLHFPQIKINEAMKISILLLLLRRKVELQQVEDS